ncbi:hypothetical protein V4U86_27055 [Mycobacterium sp. AMU20-3851]|uniref:hypothetical protein n=1 Tax=Mycobacterium sp. AMU20-3851 TaxID=3122055 RepID=UPI003754E8BF
MKATILIPMAVLAAAGAATAVGVSMTSSADDAPASPIVVHAPQRVPGPAGSDLPAAPHPATPPPPLVSAEPKLPPPPIDVPAPPPAITSDDDDWDDDDDGGWDD